MRPHSLASLLVAGSVLVAGSAAAQRDSDDASLRAGWARLSTAERGEAMEWFRAECEGLQTLQMRHVRFALELSSDEPGLWPMPGEAPFYAPEAHAPELVIARKRLSARSSKARKAREKFLPAPRAGALRSSYGYDWATGSPLRLTLETEPEAIFENALAGYAPDTDLARVLLLQVLDDGSERAGYAAFAHAYTDRKGNVYPGLTLYDAWRSSKPMEMPDVDNLGLVHDLLDEWERWVSPVATRDQEPLYEQVALLFAPLPRHRELRETLADLFLSADPAPVGTYAPAHTALHAVWIEAELDPDQLAASLPAAPGVEEWLRGRMALRSSDPELLAQAEARRARLRQDAGVLRRVLTGVLRQMGAFDEEG